jgi:tetratricopeptide (TPR) repeat protein
LAIVDGASGTQRWSHRFALSQLDLSDRIETVAAQAARAFIVEMHMAAAEIAAASPLSERSAADLALQGWASIYEGLSPGNLERAQHFFEEAVAKDPSHCRSLAGLCISNHFRAQMGWAPDRPLAQQRVLDIAARLEKLYPNDKLTALASGSAADIERRWDLRLSIGDHLCERDPTSPTSHFARAIALIRLGRFDECLEEIDTALRLSVDDFRAGWWHSIAATAHLMSGRHKQAVPAARRAIAANACLPWPPLLLAAALAGDGATAEAREVLRQHLAREPQCNRRHVMMLLSGGDADYERECERIVATLESLGLPGA